MTKATEIGVYQESWTNYWAQDYLNTSLMSHYYI